MENFGVKSKNKYKNKQNSDVMPQSDIISSDPHLKILWPRSVPALQHILYEALDQEALTIEDIRSLVGGVNTIVTSPSVRSQNPTDGLIKLESYKGRLSLLYPGLNFSGPSNFSAIPSVALVSETDESWHTLMSVEGVSYYMPTSSMDVIYPIEVLETFGVSPMTSKFNKGCYVVRKVPLEVVQYANRSILMSEMSHDNVTEIPVKFDVQSLVDKKVALNLCTADKYAVGVATEDGYVELPYERLTCYLPSAKGEVFLLGQNSKGKWFPIDVVSRNRNLRMSILKGMYGTCEGNVPMVYSTAGQLIICSAGGPIELFKAIKLNREGKLTYSGMYTMEAEMWLLRTFEGCAFNFEQYFGYSALQKKVERIDCGMAEVKNSELHYEVTVEEMIRQNVTLSGDWILDIHEMLGIEVKNSDNLTWALCMASKYVYSDGNLYYEGNLVNITPEILHELWFNFLGIKMYQYRGHYFTGTSIVDEFKTLEVRRFRYTCDGNKILIKRVGRGAISDKDRAQRLFESVKVNYPDENGDEFYVVQDKGKDAMVVEKENNRLRQAKRIKGMAHDWKTRLNHEMNIRGMPPLKYEHEVECVGGVPRFKSFVKIKDDIIRAEGFQSSKKASDMELAEKVFHKIIVPLMLDV